MMTKHQEAIKRALDLLCSGGQKVTSELSQSWIIALNDCQTKHIYQATDIVLKDKSTDYLIKPGVFRDICLQLKHSEKSAVETEQNPYPDPFIRNKEKSVKEAQRIQAAIRKGLPVFNKIPCPKMDLMEYLDAEGNLKKVIADGHVDIEVFRDNCANQFFANPKRVFHGFHREEKRHSNITKGFRTMVQCASNSGGAPITIGII